MPAVWSGLVGLLLLSQSPATSEELAKAIKNLNHDNFSIRERATIYLWKVGRHHEEHLQSIHDGTNELETKRRLATVLDKLRWGIYPETPPQIKDLLADYRTSANKVEVLKKLLEFGPPGAITAGRWIQNEEKPELRRGLAQNFDRDGFLKLLAKLIWDQDLAGLEDILTAWAATGSPQHIQDYVAFLVHANLLPSRVERWQKKTDDPIAARVLALMHRAHGDPVKAREAAARAEDDAFHHALLKEQRAWHEVLKRQPGLDSDDLLAYKAALYRLTGQKDLFEKTYAQIDMLTKDYPPHAQQRQADLMLVNARFGPVLDLYERTGKFTSYFEVMLGQQRYEEAFDKVEEWSKKHPNELWIVQLKKARTLYSLGEKEQALRELGDVSKKVLAEGNQEQTLKLLEALVECEQLDQAIDAAKSSLKRLNPGQDSAWILPGLFPAPRGSNDENKVAGWWPILLQTRRSDDIGLHFQRMFRLQKKKIDKGELTELVRLAQEIAADPKKFQVEKIDDRSDFVPPSTGLNVKKAPGIVHLKTAIKTCQILDQDEMAIECLEHLIKLHPEAESWNLKGDHHLARKNLEKAAESFAKAVELDISNAHGLYFHGHCLTHLGREDEGKKRKDLANWLLLGGIGPRFALGKQLKELNLLPEANRQMAYLRQLGEPQDWNVRNAYNYAGNEALKKKEYFEAAQHFEHVALSVMDPFCIFVDEASYLRSPAYSQRLRARGKFRAGQTDEAYHYLQNTLDLMPFSTDTVLWCVPEMEKLGHKRQADELFTRTFEHFEKLSEKYPRSAQGHNQVAWLAANRGRELDKALTHAKKAVEIEGDKAGFYDTLAEVHFQRGETAEALKANARSQALDSKKEYYRLQERRIAAGDRKVPLPEE